MGKNDSVAKISLPRVLRLGGRTTTPNMALVGAGHAPSLAVRGEGGGQKSRGI